MSNAWRNDPAMDDVRQQIGFCLGASCLYVIGGYVWFYFLTSLEWFLAMEHEGVILVSAAGPAMLILGGSFSLGYFVGGIVAVFVLLLLIKVRGGSNLGAIIASFVLWWVEGYFCWQLITYSA